MLSERISACYCEKCLGGLYTQPAYIRGMHACFVELPAFERLRERYLDDRAYLELQTLLLLMPEAGRVIEGTGGLRKLRFGDLRRGKGKRSGLRIVYYYWLGESQIWLFSVFDKDEAEDLTQEERRALRQILKHELRMRSLN